MDDLKPCPFCGAGETSIRENGKLWMGMKYSEPSSVSIIHHCEKIEGQPTRAIERVGRDEPSAIESWNCRANPSPVQAEQSLEVVDFKLAYHLWLTRLDDVETATFKSAFDAGVEAATAALAQKDAEIARLILESAKMLTTSQREGERLIVENNTLRAQLAEAEKDVRNWRQYQARKQAVIDAGMGKNPLRDATLRAQLNKEAP